MNPATAIVALRGDNLHRKMGAYNTAMMTAITVYFLCRGAICMIIHPVEEWGGFNGKCQSLEFKNSPLVLTVQAIFCLFAGIVVYHCVLNPCRFCKIKAD